MTSKTQIKNASADLSNFEIAPAEKWSTEDVASWLKSKGFQELVNLITNEHKVDGIALLSINENDIKTLDIKALGDSKRLYAAILKVQKDNMQYCIDNGIVVYNAAMYNETAIALIQSMQGTFSVCPNCREKDSLDSKESREVLFTNGVTEKSNAGLMGLCRHSTLEPEYSKTLLSVLYFIAVTWLTAIVMVIVHDRVPDKEKYPPLPDIFLDNVPLIPWAFDFCEITGCILASVWVCVLIFHKHRFILLRRMCALLGSVFLLRCVTMLITSLSVPGRHLDCRARPYGDFWAKLYQAFSIWKGGGMSLQGVRSCGDYMFSGHTVMLTMFNFFITEYTSRSLYFLHTASWVLNLFGIFFILAAHEHYSIDVFIAFYISTRLFLYYHTLANNRDLMQRDSKRTRIWFPLFSFFEAKVGGIVPNEFEYPIRVKQVKFLYNQLVEMYLTARTTHPIVQIENHFGKKQ